MKCQGNCQFITCDYNYIKIMYFSNRQNKNIIKKSTILSANSAYSSKNLFKGLELFYNSQFYIYFGYFDSI